MIRLISIFLILLCTEQLSLAQDVVKIGLWENFDVGSIGEKYVYSNSNETLNGKDDDNNGYVDDIHGIGFDEFEQLTSWDFDSKEDTTGLFDHGTAVANIIKRHCSSIVIFGSSFVPTSKRLEKSGLLELSEKERRKNLKKEYRSMRNWVNTSFDYFQENEVDIVNISWGLNLNSFKKVNENMGSSDKKKIKNSKRWLSKFKSYLEEGFANNEDILFVVSAGNEGLPVSDAYDVPALINLPNVIVVGALDVTKQSIASYSNTGEEVTVYAPGTNIYLRMSNGKTAVEDGCSFATPFVTAFAAHQLLINPEIKPSEIKQMLKEKHFVTKIQRKYDTY